MRFSSIMVICVLLVCNPAAEARTINKGATDQWVTIKIIDATDGSPETGVVAATAGLDLEYFRLGAAAVDLTEADDADPNSHSDGGLYHIGHGIYLVGLPDAAFAYGTDFVNTQGTATGMIVIGETIQLTDFDLQQASSSVAIGRVWYVDNQTDGSGDDGSKVAPFNTIAAAVAVVQSGDTIYLNGGVTYTEVVDLSSTHNVTIRGESRAAVLISNAVVTQGAGLIECGDGTTVSDLSIVVSSGNGAAIAASGKRNITIDNVTASGQDDGLYFDYTFSTFNGTVVSDSLIYARYDVVRLKGGNGVLLENCDLQLFTAKDPAEPQISGVRASQGGTSNTTVVATLRNCRISFNVGSEHASDTFHAYGVWLEGSEGGLITVEDCFIEMDATDPNNHGNYIAAYCNTDSGVAGKIQLKNCSIDVSSAGDGTVQAASGHVDGGIVELVNCTFADSLGTNAYQRTPQINFAATGGIPTAVGTRTEIDSNSTQLAKLGTPAGASISADNAAIKAETALIVADTNELQTDWANGGRLDVIQDAILVDTGTTLPGLIGSAVPVSQVPVPTSRTFKLSRTSSGLVGEKSKSLQIGEAKTFAVDFYADLPTNGRLSAFDAITIKTGTAGGVTFDTSNKGIDKTQAKIEITAVTAGTYVVNVVVTYSTASGGGATEADVTIVVVN